MIDIRDAFFEELYKKIKFDKKIILITVDQGAFTIKKIMKDFPKNYMNIGISEQNAFNVAVGLAKRNFKPYVYLISPFTLRALEQIKIGLCSMNQRITIVASGPGFTYASDGPTHYFNEDYGILKNFPNLDFLCTSDSNSAKRAFIKSYKSNNPTFVRLEKGSYPTFGKYKNVSFNYVKAKSELLVVSNGFLSMQMKKILEDINFKYKFGLLDLTQLIPLEWKKIRKIFTMYEKILFIDESPFVSSVNKDIHYLCLNDKKVRKVKFSFTNTKFKFWKIAGNRKFLLEQNSLDQNSLENAIMKIIKK